MSNSSNGVILYQGEGFDGHPIVVIATIHSENVKTGNMVQIWILKESQNPVEAVNTGEDSTICGDCPHRKGNGCYVNVGQAPLAVWRVFKDGRYPMWDGDLSLFSERTVRFGAYGDPVLIPLFLVQMIAEECDGWTGYTHAWRTHPEYRPYFMASVDSPSEQQTAIDQGWRTFRIKRKDDQKLKREILCLSSKLTCTECLACNGSGEHSRTVNIVIDVHGRGANRIALPLI